MAKGIFVTGTGTDVGKTYVTALIVKKLADAGIHAGYYKAALSGAESIEESDAGYVKKIAGITQEDSSLLSYLYQNAVSPHLAARIEGNPVDPETVKADFDRVKKEFDYVTVERGVLNPNHQKSRAHRLKMAALRYCQSYLYSLLAYRPQCCNK